jgi:inner membrane protein
MREGKGWLIGDLRYDREPDLGFAELALPDELPQCPRNVPPWMPPRSDVLKE